MNVLHILPRRLPLLAGAALFALFLAACQSDNTGPTPPQPGHGEAHFDHMVFNDRWYRTLDSTDELSPADGSFIYSWVYSDAARHPDSFYLGVDTLWRLPQDVGGDTANDWDLGICPAGLCVGGIRSGLFGLNVAAPFAEFREGENIDTFTTEHHFQFTPALHPVVGNPPRTWEVAPDSSLFGALMYVRSRSGSSKTDTVLGFAAWKLEWDTAYPPPVRPVNGYLPRRADFKIVNGKVRYQP
jgi:hypothetical protein